MQIFKKFGGGGKKYLLTLLLVMAFISTIIVNPVFASDNRVKEITVSKVLRSDGTYTPYTLTDPGRAIGTITFNYTAYYNTITFNYIDIEFNNGIYPRLGNLDGFLYGYNSWNSEQEGQPIVLDSIKRHVEKGTPLEYQEVTFAKKLRFNINKSYSSLAGVYGLNLQGNMSISPGVFIYNYIFVENSLPNNRYYWYWYDSKDNKVKYYTLRAGDTSSTSAKLIMYDTYSSGSPIVYNFIYTTGHAPGLTYSGVSETEATLNWENPNTNSNSTRYTLQKRKLGGAWENIVGATNTLDKTYKDTALIGGLTYEYRVRVHHIAGVSWDVYSDIVQLTTEQNPATAAAKEAAVKAEQARVYAANASDKSEQAKQSADSTLSQVTNTDYGLSALKNEILNIKTTINSNKPAPTINYLKGLNNATATIYSFFMLDTSVSNATHYKIKGGTWEKYTNNQIKVHGIEKGVNKIEIDFGNFVEKDGVLEGSTSKGILTIFGL